MFVNKNFMKIKKNYFLFSPNKKKEEKKKYTLKKEEKHKSVLKDKLIEYLTPKPNKIYIDATFGDGGHSSILLNKYNNLKIIAIDRDINAENEAKKFIEKYNENRFIFILGKFAEVMERLNSNPTPKASKLLKEQNGKVSGIFMDLGASTHQLLNANRGFSFQKEKEGPLDMRMNGKNFGLSAYDIVNKFNQKELEHIIIKYGEELPEIAKRISNIIVQKRKEKPIQTTWELASLIQSLFTEEYLKLSRINVCTKTFQALRIYINDELHQLRKGLIQAEKLLEPDGRLVIISFHSLEFDIVQTFFNFCSGNFSNYSLKPSLSIITSKPITPSPSEIFKNKRSRSAKMQVAVRLNSPPIGNLIEEKLLLIEEKKIFKKTII